MFFTANTKSFNNLLARRFAKNQLALSATTVRASEHKIYTRAAPAANSSSNSLEEREVRADGPTLLLSSQRVRATVIFIYGPN